MCQRSRLAVAAVDLESTSHILPAFRFDVLVLLIKGQTEPPQLRPLELTFFENCKLCKNVIFYVICGFGLLKTSAVCEYYIWAKTPMHTYATQKKKKYGVYTLVMQPASYCVSTRSTLDCAWNTRRFPDPATPGHVGYPAERKSYLGRRVWFCVITCSISSNGVD